MLDRRVNDVDPALSRFFLTITTDSDGMFQHRHRWTCYDQQNEHRKGGPGLNIVTILIIVLIVLAIVYFAKRV